MNLPSLRRAPQAEHCRLNLRNLTDPLTQICTAFTSRKKEDMKSSSHKKTSFAFEISTRILLSLQQRPASGQVMETGSVLSGSRYSITPSPFRHGQPGTRTSGAGSFFGQEVFVLGTGIGGEKDSGTVLSIDRLVSSWSLIKDSFSWSLADLHVLRGKLPI